MAEQITSNLHRNESLSLRNKKFPTYDIIGHMVWQPYWIYTKTYKTLLLQTAGQIEGKLHTNVPQALRVQVC